MRNVYIRKRNPERVKEYNWRDRNIRLTMAQYNLLLHNQNYRCGICGRHENEFKRKLGVDHDHSSLEIRGLLCNNCNSMLGQAKDNIWILERAIKYLSKQICLESLEREIV